MVLPVELDKVDIYQLVDVGAGRQLADQRLVPFTGPMVVAKVDPVRVETRECIVRADAFQFPEKSQCRGTCPRVPKVGYFFWDTVWRRVLWSVVVGSAVVTAFSIASCTPLVLLAGSGCGGLVFAGVLFVSGYAVCAWEFAVALYWSLIKGIWLQTQGVGFTFCFLRWHSVQEITVRLRFLGGGRDDPELSLPSSSPTSASAASSSGGDSRAAALPSPSPPPPPPIHTPINLNCTILA